MDPVEPAEQPAVSGGVGPLDESTVRPLRTLVAAKLACMAVLVVVAIGGGALLAPQVATGLGLAPEVAARVTSIEPLPAGDTVPGAGCTRQRVHVVWAGDNAGSFITCVASADASGDGQPSDDASGMRVRVGDVLAVHAVAGWQSVVIGSWIPNSVVVVVLLGILVLAAVGATRYVREMRAIATLTRTRVMTPPLPATRVGFAMASDAVTLGKGKRATLQMRFDDASLRPLRLQVPGATPEAMQWTSAIIRPVGHTRTGAPTGPYIVETPGGGRLLAAGRQIRRAQVGASDDHA